MSATHRLQERFELLVAGRLLRSKRSAHLSLISVMSIAGIALGVAALIVVLAVNTGFQGAFQERILSTWPHMVAMRRGLDLRDWRAVVQRVQRLPFVRRANPATYDDMMLSSADGRAGAVVRGVPAETLEGLPEGVVVAGKLDLRGETPQVSWKDDVMAIGGGSAGGRHVVIAHKDGARWAASTVPVIAPAGELGAVLLIDQGGCPTGREKAENTGVSRKSGVSLRYGSSKEVVRHVDRGCGALAQWELMEGPFELVLHGGTEELATDVARLTVKTGATTVVVLGRKQAVVVAPGDGLPDTAAAVAVVSLASAPLKAQIGTAKAATVEAGRWRAWQATLPAIALGEGLAKKLQVQLGDEVRAVSPLREDSGGTRSSAAGRFAVGAIVRTGFYDHDQRLALVDFSAAQRFLGRGDVAHWVDVRIDDPLLAKQRAPHLRAALEPVTMGDLLDDLERMQGKVARIQSEVVPGLLLRKPTSAVEFVDNWVSGARAARQARTRSMSMFRVIDWEEMNRNIFDAARMQKVAMSLFPFIIVLVAALNVIGTQAVVVHERGRDIAILRAMGATRRSVGSIFLVQGLAVGLAGTVIGLLLGGLCCLLLDAVGYPLDPHVYLISELPVHIEAQTFVMAGGAATLLTFAAAWLAARRAAARSPVDGLRRLD